MQPGEQTPLDAVGRDGEPVGRLIAVRADRLVLEIPDLGRLEVPPHELLKAGAAQARLRHDAAWYMQLRAVETPSQPQDGRMHDVSVDGSPAPELERDAKSEDDEEPAAGTRRR